MKTITSISLAALLVALLAGCSEPAPPPAPAEPVAAPAPAPEPPPVAAPEPPKAPEPAVARAEIEKAAALFQVLHDAALADDKKAEAAAARMEANGWTEESYQALLYDIAQDAPSRAVYVGLTGAAN